MVVEIAARDLSGMRAFGAVSLDLGFASYHSSVSAKGNLLHYEREYVVRQVEIPPAKASEFRHLESVILSDEKNAAVLKKQ